MKKLLNTTFIFLLIFMTSCSGEIYNTEDTASKIEFKNSVSFEEFKNATGLKNFKKTISIHPKGMENTITARYQLEDFVIDTDYIKQTVTNEKIAYSFTIFPIIVTNDNVFNLIVYNMNNNWEYSIVELEPDAQTHAGLEAGIAENFKGRLRELYSSAARNSIECFKFFVPIFHCTQTGSCASGTCDMCSLCVGTDTFVLCGTDNSDEFQPAEIVQLPGNGGGDGTNTSPYNPPASQDIVFQPNLQHQNLGASAGAFWAQLDKSLKGWAIANHSLYNLFLNDYLAQQDEETAIAISQMIWSMANNDDYSGDGFTEDNDDTNTDYTGPKQLIPQSIVTTDGTTVEVTFGTTESDNQNANKQVAVSLVNAIKSALDDANSSLPAGSKITSIYISATTNGTHGSNSNHYKGTAVDISRINGNKIVILGPNNQVSALQNGFQNGNNIRENFGPSVKLKTETDGTVNNSNVKGHHDHIHISAQNN
ncbi:MAG: hypothetical protein PSV16_02075 [Flavobacterium sp.]|nr:hypothetical protein [Flavobacterium sp.]